MRYGSGFAFFILLILNSSLWAHSPLPGLSAMRDPKVNGREVMRDYENDRAIRDLQRGGTDQNRPASVYETRLGLNKVDTRGLPEFSSEELNKMFIDLRDHRPLTDYDQRSRRLTWLYPDDGCYARAELMVDEVSRQGLSLPKKVFMFGNLSARSGNHPSGWVTWWYHVAPIVASEGQVYVLDPSLDPRRPLTLQEWVGAGTDSSAEVAICRSHAYDPDSDCETGHSNDSQASRGFRDEAMFLDLEWDRVSELGRDPAAELGDFPPWSHALTRTLH